MPKLIKIFATGLLISFLGSLPLGTLNIAAMQISISDGVADALWFSLGSLTAEMVYVRLSLVAMDWVRKQQKLFRILEYVTLAIVLALAISSFYAALHPSVKKNVFLSSSLHPYILGLTMSAVNPVQIPFWFGWSTVLFTKKVLLPRSDHYNMYIVGIGLGTLAGNCLFIFGGKLLADSIQSHEDIMNWVIGGIFAVTALIQIYRMTVSKKNVQHQLEHPDEMTKKFSDRLDQIEDKIEEIERKNAN